MKKDNDPKEVIETWVHVQKSWGFGLHSEFQGSQGYVVRACLKNKTHSTPTSIPMTTSSLFGELFHSHGAKALESLIWPRRSLHFIFTQDSSHLGLPLLPS